MVRSLLDRELSWAQGDVLARQASGPQRDCIAQQAWQTHASPDLGAIPIRIDDATRDAHRLQDGFGCSTGWNSRQVQAVHTVSDFKHCRSIVICALARALSVLRCTVQMHSGSQVQRDVWSDCDRDFLRPQNAVEFSSDALQDVAFQTATRRGRHDEPSGHFVQLDVRQLACKTRLLVWCEGRFASCMPRSMVREVQHRQPPSRLSIPCVFPPCRHQAPATAHAEQGIWHRRGTGTRQRLLAWGSLVVVSTDTLRVPDTPELS